MSIATEVTVVADRGAADPVEFSWFQRLFHRSYILHITGASVDVQDYLRLLDRVVNR
jgi:hypothetical protein